MYKKIPYENSVQILQRFELSEEAQVIVTGEQSPTQAVSLLQQHGLFIDLINYISHALPMREVIWWACVSLQLRANDWSKEQSKAVMDAKRWVEQPEESLRRVCEQYAIKSGPNGAPGWLAQAVFWSGTGSIAPAGQPQVLPPDFLHAKAVSGAINTAALMPEWTGYERYYQQVVLSAINIAQGGKGLL